jgi:hypothetical protein
MRLHALPENSPLQMSLMLLVPPVEAEPPLELGLVALLDVPPELAVALS